MKKKIRDINKPTTLGDLDDLGAHIIGAVSKETTRIEEKIDGIDNKLSGKIDALDKKVDNLDYKVSDIHRRVIDPETIDPPTRSEFTDLKGQLSSHSHR